MGAKRRTSKRKAPITEAEAAWLIGDQANDGFTEFGKPWDDNYLPNLRRDHGDHKRFYWVPGMMRPLNRTAAEV
jgi:hypothetical protein